MNLEITANPLEKQATLDSLNLNIAYPNLKQLELATDSLSKLLNRRGYINHESQELKKINDSTYSLTVSPGNQYTWITIYYPKGQVDQNQLSKLFANVTPQYFKIPFDQLEPSLLAINNLFAKQGNAFISSQLSNLVPQSTNSLSADLILNTGNKRTIDALIVKGYEKFPKTFLKYYAGLKTGTPFSQEQIREDYTAVSSLPFVTSLKPPEVLFKPDSTTVYLYLEKSNSNSFDGIIGFSNSETDSKLIFNGYLDLRLENNLNFGESLELQYKSDGNEQTNFKVNTSLPYLFGSPFGADLELYIFKRDSSFVTVEQKAMAHYQLNPRTKLYAGYKNYESNNLQDQALTNVSIIDYNANFFLGGIDYNQPQDSPLFPFKTAWELTGAIGKRESDLNSDQFKLTFDGSYIFNLNLRNSIFIRNSTQTLVSDNYLENELLRFGGINSIRGFDENSISAQLFSVLNTEYRYILNSGLYVHSIIDVGYLENELIDLKEELLSFGIGIGLASKAGIFRLNIANGKTQSIPFSFSNTKIHLSLRSNF